MKRPKDEQISHKDGCLFVHPARSAVPSTTFCGNIPLTYKRGFPILTSNESKFLSKNIKSIKQIGSHRAASGHQQRLHQRSFASDAPPRSERQGLIITAGILDDVAEQTSGEKLNPKRIRSKSELQRVADLLKRYYEERPDSYGLMDREQTQYDSYVDIVSQWTPESGKILDLGCGTFRTPQLLHQKGFEVVGCDLFSPEKLDEYRQMLQPGGPRLTSYDGYDLPFEKESFDTVSILCVSEHVTDMDHFLLEMSRVLKPNGHLVIVGPNLFGPHRMVLGTVRLLTKHKRFWQFFTIRECLWGFIKFFIWTLSVWLTRTARFIYIYPLIENDNIFFEQPDDDAVHINHPLSFKKWFRQHGFLINQYNNRCGDSPLTRLFNKMFPSLATKLQIVAQKSG